ncbi:MAG: ribosome small subunit-dependent GTPase A [Candidatus Brachytrichaceae bacterium NZ_4S206]
MTAGTVLSGTGGVWQVLLDDGRTVDASLRGRLKKDEERGVVARDGERPRKLAVGDRVEVESEPGPDGLVVHAIGAIAPRRSQLARRAPGRAFGERIVVANLDQVLVVFAIANPEPHPRMLDRFLVIAEANDLAARIVVNKCDLADNPTAHERFVDYERAGYPVHYTSVPSGAGLVALRDAVQGKVSALTGPSGVGKSSLMNALFPGLTLRVGAISESVNKGRHTTVGALLHPLPGGGFVADTPGLREVGLWGIDVRDVAHCFPEFRPYLDACRFADCTHLVEPGCAVREAVASGAVSRSRWESYAKQRDELEDATPAGW